MVRHVILNVRDGSITTRRGFAVEASVTYRTVREGPEVRPERPQIVLGIAVTRENFPLRQGFRLWVRGPRVI